MIALDLTQEQRAAVEGPLDASFAIVGAAGTGKSTTLAQRGERARALSPDAQPLILSAARALG
ncbi:MAG: hypothetical protein WA668_11700, partial [Candidatus Cybelea sp.]